MDDLRVKILEGTIPIFNEKGMKFTMDDIAKTLGISKKTIYTVFNDKEELFLAMVDYLFDEIKLSEKAVVADPRLTTEEKIRKILGVMPEGYKNIDFTRLYLLKDKYPEIYKKVEERLENGWETTLDILNRGVEEGVVRPIKLPILKMMLEASIEQFFQRDILKDNDMTYSEGLDAVVDILIEGIIKK